jgi:hypothetical protein
VPIIEEVSRQIMSSGRAIKFLTLKSKEKDSTNQREFYQGVNEKEGMFHVKINILGSNLKQVLWML